MAKKEYTKQDIRAQFIDPAIRASGWKNMQVRREYAITKGRIIARGGTYKRDTAKFADYVLFYKPHIPLAIIEAKDNNHSIGEGMQQALDYAQRLMVPFVFTSNGDGFAFHNRLIEDGIKEQIISLSDFPSPEKLWEMYKQKTNLTSEKEQIISEPYYMEREDKTPRYYQLNAINMTVDAIASEQN